MAVDTPHPSYTASLDDWQKIRDVISGQRAMQNTSRDYLRRPAGMTDDMEWARYVRATPFFEATQRTVEGLTGLAFYREPALTLPPGMKGFVDDATQDGVPLRAFVEATFEEVLTLARVGVLLEQPERDPTIRSQLDVERSGRRPYIRRYRTEDIIHWTVGKVGNVWKLTQVRLREVEEEALDDFTTRSRDRIRVLQLTKNAEGKWTYSQRIFVHKEWRKEDGSAWGATAENNDEGPKVTPPAQEADAWVEERTVPFLVNGKPIDYIPFWIINPRDQTPAISRPPLLGLANTNVAHFNTSALVENALFWVGTPQPWVAGLDPDTTTTLSIGSSTAWVFKDPQAKAGLLSLESKDIEALDKRLDRLEQHMAVLGAKMLASEKRAVEAAETARIGRQGEISILARICGTVSRIFTDIVRTASEWEGHTGETLVAINTVLFDQEISLDDALKAVTLWQKNVISINDLLALLKKGEIIAPERTAESIQSENQTSAIQPIIPNLTDSSGGIGQPPTNKPKLKPNPPAPKPKPAE